MNLVQPQALAMQWQFFFQHSVKLCLAEVFWKRFRIVESLLQCQECGNHPVSMASTQHCNSGCLVRLEAASWDNIMSMRRQSRSNPLQSQCILPMMFGPSQQLGGCRPWPLSRHPSKPETPTTTGRLGFRKAYRMS
mmetsp:Transcript_17431/g.42746  ORF Transcript_17431/g.42746 Transcript_17431/m.42746 type:complete len:136 (+) Transcript_17431:1034-1441(+)